MQHQTRYFLGGALFALAAAFPIHAIADSPKATLLVDDDKVQCPTAQYTDIEDAVMAAPAGATIHVCPGLYKKQVLITKRLTIQADTGSVLQPPSVAVNTSNLVTGVAIAALILVQGTEGVSIDDLTVDGVLDTQTSCGPFLVGVMYQNASGQLTNMAIRNLRQGPGLGGCQSGLGVFVQSGNGGSSTVSVSGSSVHDYQKGGIAGDETGTTLTLVNNAVTGDGPTDQIAQNGLQLAFGATGSFIENRVANHVYTVCSSQSSCPAVSTNIVIDNSSGVTVRGNVTINGQVGIFVLGDNNTVQNNNIADNLIFDGIDLLGNNDKALNNSIFHTDGSGISVAGTGDTVSGNVINEASVGIFKGSGTTLSGGGNTFYNVPVIILPTGTNHAAAVAAGGPPVVSVVR